jgi:hypothetical protein
MLQPAGERDVSLIAWCELWARRLDNLSRRNGGDQLSSEVIEAGMRAFRDWERRFNDPAEAYPFYDSELREAVTAVFLAMTRAHIAS